MTAGRVGGTVRCAIYTRKSSEEGLEQDFNSLDAQRESCAAYILSQASEGWSLVEPVYNDGGISGGTLERPALQRLLADIEAGRIDIIVVYKVDRLTRSLLDFARLVEAFDRKGVSFVSVTQSFNTTTSMGRLTLNMLLSFAQFEREVTAERIRDKLAASKAKGMWMGGMPPPGYRPDGRSLAIIEEDAMIIRQLYTRYLELGSVRALAEELEAKAIFSPRRTTATGKPYGGGPFTRGQLYNILNNPIYTGRISHRRRVHSSGAKATYETKIYPGNHPAIIEQDQWDQVQEKLSTHTNGPHRGRSPSSSLLAGLLVDEAGEPLIATHATKGKNAHSRTRYRYYVSKALHHRTNGNPDIRIPAREIEQLVIGEIASLFTDPLDLAASAGFALTPEDLPRLTPACAKLQSQMGQRNLALHRSLIEQVRVTNHGITIILSAPSIADHLGQQLQADAPPHITLHSSARLTRTGLAVRLVQDNGATALKDSVDPALLRLIIRARGWWAILREGNITPTTLAAQEGVTVSYLQRVVRLAFLAPSITQAILDGTLRAGIDRTLLVQPDAISPYWHEQEKALLPG